MKESDYKGGGSCTPLSLLMVIPYFVRVCLSFWLLENAFGEGLGE
jgi:hypothetical protein